LRSAGAVDALRHAHGGTRGARRIGREQLEPIARIASRVANASFSVRAKRGLEALLVEDHLERDGEPLEQTHRGVHEVWSVGSASSSLSSEK
jgi:hypothetical protein